MRIDSLNRLYVHQLKDLYSAEKQLLDALPKLAKQVSNDKLRQAMEMHLEETQGQVQGLERIFEGLDFSPTGERCKGMEGLIVEGEEAMEDAEDDDVRDAAIIAAAQRVEHYEISGYGTAVTYAKMLDRKDDTRILQEILDQEQATDTKLNEIALNVVNPAAAGAA